MTKPPTDHRHNADVRARLVLAPACAGTETEWQSVAVRYPRFG